jgi:hypothetical protein
MRFLCKQAAAGATRSGGKFAIISLSEAGHASYYCTHNPEQMVVHWQNEDLQQWLDGRCSAAMSASVAAPSAVDIPALATGHTNGALPDLWLPVADLPAMTPASAAYKLKGLGKMKTRLAQAGVATVAQLATASESVLQEILNPGNAQQKLSYLSAFARAKAIMGVFTSPDGDVPL